MNPAQILDQYIIYNYNELSLSHEARLSRSSQSVVTLSITLHLLLRQSSPLFICCSLLPILFEKTSYVPVRYTDRVCRLEAEAGYPPS